VRVGSGTLVRTAIATGDNDKPQKVSEVRLRPRISENDLKVKIKTINRLLDRGDRVKIKLQLWGREVSHPSLGEDVVKSVLEQLDVQTVAPLKTQGRAMSTVVERKRK